jgi:hypothetical protein
MTETVSASDVLAVLWSAPVVFVMDSPSLEVVALPGVESVAGAVRELVAA